MHILQQNHENYSIYGAFARWRRNHSSLQQRKTFAAGETIHLCRNKKLESAQISAKFLNTFRADPSKIHKYLQYSQNLTGGRNELENQSEILILLQLSLIHI